MTDLAETAANDNIREGQTEEYVGDRLVLH